MQAAFDAEAGMKAAKRLHQVIPETKFARRKNVCLLIGHERV